MAGNSEKLELLISAKNTADSALKEARNDVRALERQVRKATDAFEATGSGRRDLDRLITSLEEARLESKKLAAAAKDADQAVDKFGRSAVTAGRKTASMNRDMDKTRRGSSMMVAGWGKVAGVAAGVTAAIAGLSGAFRFLTSSVEEARQQRKSIAQLSAVLRSMGRSESPEMLERLAGSLSRMSGLEDDEILASINLMLTFGQITGKTFKQAETAAVDLSAAFGMDLQSATVMVGKALNSPIGGLTSLMRVGVSFTDQQKEQVKAMMEVGNLAGAQKIIMGELQRQVSGSAAAQADGIDKARIAWKDLQQVIGDVLMSTGTGFDLVGLLQDATKWIKQHKRDIVSVLQQIISVVFKVISIFLKWQSIVLKTFGYLFGAMTTTLTVLNKLGLVSDNTVNSVRTLADGFGAASEEADNASKYFNNLSTGAHEASRRSRELADALKGVKSKKVRLTIETVMTDVYSAVDAAVDAANGGLPRRRKKNDPTGDTALPRSRGPVALMGAHRGLDAGIPGRRTITSATRFHNLGSAGSDHARSRALDLTGPGLGTYARRVRAGGGYAAFHGPGPDRHLHAVPTGGGGSITQVFDVDVHADHTVDVIAAMRAAQREAAMRARELSP